MLDARSVQNIDIFKKPKIKELILSSNSWDNFSNNINQFGNDSENNKSFPEYISIKAYPNPFNSNCKIEFELPNDEFLNIDIYSLRGEFIENLFSGKKSKGQHRYHWNVNSMFSHITTGIFFISLNGKRVNATRKILYLK